MSRHNYIFVDFENIQDVDLALITGKEVTVILVLGERHKTLPTALVSDLLTHASQVRLIQTGKAGKNALDFVLAYQVGLQAAKDPDGFFHILSHDKGFDALVGHLKDTGVFAGRHDVFAKIPVLINAPAITLAERVRIVTERLACNPASRPKREKTLRSHIHSHFGKQLSEPELDEVLATLVGAGVIEVTPQGEVLYKTA